MLRQRIDSVLELFKKTELKIKLVQFVLTLIVIILLIFFVRNLYIGTAIAIFGSVFLINLLYLILCLYCEEETALRANGLLQQGEESFLYRTVRFWDRVAGLGDDHVLNRAVLPIRAQSFGEKSFDIIPSVSFHDSDVEDVDLGDNTVGGEDVRSVRNASWKEEIL